MCTVRKLLKCSRHFTLKTVLASRYILHYHLRSLHLHSRCFFFVEKNRDKSSFYTEHILSPVLQYKHTPTHAGEWRYQITFKRTEEQKQTWNRPEFNPKLLLTYIEHTKTGFTMQANHPHTSHNSKETQITPSTKSPIRFQKFINQLLICFTLSSNCLALCSFKRTRRFWAKPKIL
jgi:hypothetical protein